MYTQTNLHMANSLIDRDDLKTAQLEIQSGFHALLKILSQQ